MKTWGYMQCRNWNPIFSAEKATKLLHTAGRAVDFWQEVPWLKTSPSCWKCPHKAVIAECCSEGGEHREHKPGNPGQPLALGLFFLSTHKTLTLSPITVSEKFHRYSNQVSVWPIWNETPETCKPCGTGRPVKFIDLKKKKLRVSDYQYI